MAGTSPAMTVCYGDRGEAYGDHAMLRANDGTRTGGEILIDQLVVHGVQHVFCVPGESYLAALDAFYDRPIKLTVCRQEGGATMMAEAHGKATGRPGIVFVTRGPGATNASAGIHIAQQDSTPLIVFVGQVGREMREREAFQELDYRAVFGIDRQMGRPRSTIRRAFRSWCRARSTPRLSGRPGPGGDGAAGGHADRARRGADAPAFEPVEIWPGLADMAKLQKLLWAAKQPVVIVGGSRWSEAGARLPGTLCRALRHSGRDLVPPRQSDRLRCTAAMPAISASAPTRSCWRASRRPT